MFIFYTFFTSNFVAKSYKNCLQTSKIKSFLSGFGRETNTNVKRFLNKMKVLKAVFIGSWVVKNLFKSLLKNDLICSFRYLLNALLVSPGPEKQG